MAVAVGPQLSSQRALAGQPNGSRALPDGLQKPVRRLDGVVNGHTYLLYSGVLMLTDPTRLCEQVSHDKCRIRRDCDEAGRW